MTPNLIDFKISANFFPLNFCFSIHFPKVVIESVTYNIWNSLQGGDYIGFEQLRKYSILGEKNYCEG